MIDKVYSCSARQAHLPATGQRAQLRNRLRLHRQIIPGRSKHPDDLLPPRIDPSRGPTEVRDIIRPALGREALLPARREGPRPVGRLVAAGEDGIRAWCRRIGGAVCV